MELTVADPKTSPIVVNDDSSRDLAIIYGSLGTLIAFASLVVAILSWLRSRRHKLAAQHGANNDVERQSNTLRHTGPAKENRRTATVDNHAMHPKMPDLAAAHVPRPQSPFELDGKAIALPLGTSKSCRVSGSTNTFNHPPAAPVTETSTPPRS